jgi:hypothetical protein
MSEHPLFSGARGMLKTCGDLLDRLENQIEQARLLGDQADERRAAFEAERTEP